MPTEHTHTVTTERVREPRRVHPGQLSPDTQATVDLSNHEHPD